MNKIRFGGVTKAPHRHRKPITIGLDGVIRYACGHDCDPAKAKRGVNSRKRGNAFEREIARKLGVSRVGQYGGPEDVGASSEWIAIQTKVGSMFPERIDDLLRRIPYRAAQLRAVVHGDAPGSAGRRRSLITLDFDEFCEWYGAVLNEDAPADTSGAPSRPMARSPKG